MVLPDMCTLGSSKWQLATNVFCIKHRLTQVIVHILMCDILKPESRDIFQKV